MMTLEDLSRVIVLEGRSRGAGYVEEQIHAHGEICGVEESGAMLLYQMAHAVEFSVPARGADHHVLAGFHAGFDVRHDAVWRGEVNDGVDAGEFVGCERGAIGVFFGAGYAHVVLARGSHFRRQRTRFSAP